MHSCWRSDWEHCLVIFISTKVVKNSMNVYLVGHFLVLSKKGIHFLCFSKWFTPLKPYFKIEFLTMLVLPITFAQTIQHSMCGNVECESKMWDEQCLPVKILSICSGIKIPLGSISSKTTKFMHTLTIMNSSELLNFMHGEITSKMQLAAAVPLIPLGRQNLSTSFIQISYKRHLWNSKGGINHHCSRYNREFKKRATSSTVY